VFNALLCVAFDQWPIASALGQAATVRWISDAGGVDDDCGLAITTDATADSYVLGYFNGSAAVGPTNLVSRGGQDMFVAKSDSAGNILWTSYAGGPTNDQPRAIALDTAGNVYVTGGFVGPAQFGSTNVDGNGMEDVFLAKLESTGRWLWVTAAGGTNFDEGRGVGLDAAGNCYVTGIFSGVAKFGDTNLTSRGQTDMFLAKYDNLGGLVWARTIGGTNIDETRGLAVDSQGNCHLTGLFNGSAVFAETNLTSRGASDVFLAKFDTDGRLLWVQQAGGPDIDEGHAVALDAAGNIHLTGSFGGVADFGSTNLSAGGQADIFTALFGPSGNLLWVRKAGGASSDTGNAIAADPEGNSYVGGYFLGTASFGPVIMTSRSGQADAFLLKYDREGTVIWAFQAGGNAYSSTFGLALDTAGNGYVTGFFRSSTTFGGLILTNASAGRDAFIARIDGPPRLQVASSDHGLVLSWPAWATGFQLQSTTGLAGTNLWLTLTNLPQTDGGQQIISQAIADSRRFYRLRK